MLTILLLLYLASVKLHFKSLNGSLYRVYNWQPRHQFSRKRKAWGRYMTKSFINLTLWVYRMFYDTTCTLTRLVVSHSLPVKGTAMASIKPTYYDGCFDKIIQT